ncbi:MAG TPA: histidine kinase dimerization/phospho-acceptor domain-containing protein [Phycisphaerae bacterium]|nr:histidine kinase dimerization/phospho-acceptor domain-containing protein [Phycisphaerae bacterium]
MTSLRIRLLIGYLLLLALLVLAGAVSVFSADRVWVLILLGICAAAAGVLVYAIARGVIRPIDTLTLCARQIQSGDLDSRIHPAGAAEIANLGESLNALVSSFQELRRYDEARLLRTQETTRTAINSLPHAVAILSPEGQVELSNDLAERLFEIKSGEELGRLPHKWLRSLFDRAVETARPVESKGFDSAIQVFDHSRELFFLPYAVPILDRNQRVAGVTIILVDGTELRQIDEAKSGLIASVSHELKTPLTSIQMAIHLLLEDSARFTPRQLEILQAARDDADRLHSLIATLLDAGRQRAKPE